nr:MAG TPA: hypothetical protein [Caudoviricetes sp.]
MWFLPVLIKFLFLFADGGLSFLPYLGFPPSVFYSLSYEKKDD